MCVCVREQRAKKDKTAQKNQINYTIIHADTRYDRYGLARCEQTKIITL